MNFFRALWEDFKAFRRGERRVAPRQIRGRVYAKKGAAPSSGAVKTSARPSASLTMKITRADGSVETIKVPASIRKL